MTKYIAGKCSMLVILIIFNTLLKCEGISYGESWDIATAINEQRNELEFQDFGYSVLNLWFFCFSILLTVCIPHGYSRNASCARIRDQPFH